MCRNILLRYITKLSDDGHLRNRESVVVGNLEVFQVKGAAAVSFRDHLNSWLNTTESWKVHVFKNLPQMVSGQVAVQVLSFRKNAFNNLDINLKIFRILPDYFP